MLGLEGGNEDKAVSAVTLSFVAVGAEPVVFE
jgi:hypothetical protein